MVDKTKAGMDLLAYTFEVSRVKIRELVEAIGDSNPIYRDKEAACAEGYRDTPCPPTYITLAFQEFTGFYLNVLNTLSIPLVRALHGEEEYEYLGEIYPGDILTIEPMVESVVEKQTRSGAVDLVTLRTRITNHHGVEVLRTRSLLIERK
jgi:acyl dehydratase